MDRRREAAEEFVKRAKDKYSDMIGRILLFGSLARGDFVEESDIDILVIWEGQMIEGWNHLEAVATDIFLEFSVLLSLKVISPEDYKTMADLQMPFIQNVEREGIVLG